MARGKTTAKPAHALPIAPWIYINDPTGHGEYAHELAAMLPTGEHIQLTLQLTSTSPLFSLITAADYRKKVVVVTTNPSCLDERTRLRNAETVRAAAIKHGCNFASVNLVDMDEKATPSKTGTWGTNHLQLPVSLTSDASQVKATACNIHRWLFGVFSVPETLHLISDEEMKQLDPKTSFSDYEYCPISEANTRPRDQKLQFVALILTKPTVGPNNYISWRVADKTGSANFHFRHRGPSSQYTWDWVLGLKPGDRKCLPRMPGVLIKERAYVSVLKAPFRITGAAVRGTGLVVKSVGVGVSQVGKKISMGQRSEWVSAADVGVDARGRKYKKPPNTTGFLQYEPSGEKTSIKIFTEKGEKTWKDDDSVASTTAGDLVNEKAID